MAKTLKTLVLKTATVTGMKPVAPADRIGLGLCVANPTDNLSPGQIPMPHYPVPEQVRSRELSAMRMQQPLLSCGDAVPPVGSAGCFPGASALRSATRSATSTRGWCDSTWAAAAGKTIAVRLASDFGRIHVPGDFRHDDRLGSDCQSPDRSSDKRVAKRDVSPAAMAAK